MSNVSLCVLHGGKIVEDEGGKNPVKNEKKDLGRTAREHKRTRAGRSILRPLKRGRVYYLVLSTHTNPCMRSLPQVFSIVCYVPIN